MPYIPEDGLSTDVPDGELQSLVVDFFDIEADGGYWDDVLIEFHLIEDGGFSCVVES